MKKLSILFVSVLTLGLAVSSCSSDDDKDASIEGKWQLSQIGVVLNGQEALEPATNEGCANDIVEFKAESKFVDTYSELVNEKCTSETEEGTWTKDGNTLTKKYQNDTEKFEISELSGNTLKLKETSSEGGITFSVIAVYKKI